MELKYQNVFTLFMVLDDKLFGLKKKKKISMKISHERFIQFFCRTGFAPDFGELGLHRQTIGFGG